MVVHLLLLIFFMAQWVNCSYGDRYFKVKYLFVVRDWSVKCCERDWHNGPPRLLICHQRAVHKR